LNICDILDRLLATKIGDIEITTVQGLSDSVVTFCSFFELSEILFSKLAQLSGRDGLNVLEDDPSETFCARRSGQRSLVGIKVSKVEL